MKPRWRHPAPTAASLTLSEWLPGRAGLPTSRRLGLNETSFVFQRALKCLSAQPEASQTARDQGGWRCVCVCVCVCAGGSGCGDVCVLPCELTHTDSHKQEASKFEITGFSLFFIIIYFSLHRIFIYVQGLSLAAASRGYSSLRSTDSRPTGFSISSRQALGFEGFSTEAH